MNKIKLLSLLAVGLLVLNLFLLWFIFSHKPPPHGSEGPRDIIVEKLGFDKTQAVAYDQLIEKHKEEVSQTQQALMMLKKTLYTTLQKEGNQNEKDSLIVEITRVQAEMEIIHYNHFEALRGICKSEQQPAYDELCLEIANLFAPQPPKGKK